jgi:glycosyltransferase involved in cell wall biosynthesis
MIQPTGLSGIWHYANALSRSLAEAGLEVVLATLSPFEDLGGDGRVPIWPIGTRRADASNWFLSPVRRLLDHTGKLSRLRRVMIEYRPGIVHMHAPLGKLDFLYFRYWKSLGARVIYTAHDARPLTGEARWFDWARYQSADGILVHSSRCQQYLMSGGIDEGKITRIAHGNYLDFCQDVDLSADDARRQIGLPVNSRVVLFFGAIAPYKGLDVLIEAFSKLSREDSQIYLVIAGEPMEDFGAYRRQIDALGLSDRIVQDLRYIPFMEFSKYFLASDLVALPYRRISQSGILQLAYGFGRPVVVSNVGGLAEAVVEDRTGIVVDRLAGEDFALAIQRLLADRESTALMGSRGRSLAETKYSWRVVAQDISHVYSDVQG